MSILATILEKVQDLQIASILRERLAFVEVREKAFVEQIEKLEKEVADLKTQNTKLKSQLSAKISAEEFVEHRGALFKRKPEGGYHLAVYCPRCHKSTGSISQSIPFCCTPQCGWIANFGPRELDKVIKEL